MLVDANILLYAVDEKARAHPAARNWLEKALNGSRRVGLPWQSLLAFVRILTHPRGPACPSEPGRRMVFCRRLARRPCGVGAGAGPRVP